MTRRILFASHACYLDDSNGAAVASRALMQALARRGCAVAVVSGTMLDREEEVEPAAWIAARGERFEAVVNQAWTFDAGGVRPEVPDHFRLSVRGVPVTLHRGPTTRPHEPDDAEGREFLQLFDAVAARFRPEVVVGYGGSRLARAVFARARAAGAATVFVLHNFGYRSAEPFADVDAIVVASRFAAERYREALGLECIVLPNPVDFDRVRVEQPEPRFVTFVNPATEKGVFAFARIADELGRRRPDIPLLVVEGRGGEATLAACGLDLRAHGNLYVMPSTADPRAFWRVTRLCLVPSLCWENQPLVAVEAMLNGIPVLGSDRGGLPETLGRAGVVLPLPAWLTPSSRAVPTAAEVAPWIEAIVRLWDDADLYAERRRLARDEARRWAPEVLEPRYARFFTELRSEPAASG
ncbi:MAG TPA: glycosyltransferase, partial [Isosphaeraceae bacterium]